MCTKFVGFIGIAATIWFWLALLLFAAFDPDYTHATKAVSELGSIGAPNALLWNILGFGFVGVCLTLTGYHAARLLKPESMVASVALFLSGATFALTAVPADMNDLAAFTSVVHIIASLSTGVLWFIGASWLLGNKVAEKYYFNLVTMTALAAIVVTVLIRGSEVVMPGYAQRLSFMVYFLWIAYVSIILLKEANPPSPKQTELR